MRGRARDGSDPPKPGRSIATHGRGACRAASSFQPCRSRRAGRAGGTSGRPRPGAITGSQLLALVRRTRRTRRCSSSSHGRARESARRRGESRAAGLGGPGALAALARGWRGCAGRPSRRGRLVVTLFLRNFARPTPSSCWRTDRERRRSAPACGRASPVARRAALCGHRPNIPAPRAREGSVSRLARGIPRLPAARARLPSGLHAAPCPVVKPASSRSSLVRLPGRGRGARPATRAARLRPGLLAPGRRGYSAWPGVSSRSSASVRVALGHLAVVPSSRRPRPSPSCAGQQRQHDEHHQDDDDDDDDRRSSQQLLSRVRSAELPRLAAATPRARRLPRRAASPGRGAAPQPGGASPRR